MPRKHLPRKGDKVNDIRRTPNANGFVRRVLYGDDGPEEVVVKYDDDIVTYDYDEFRYAWTDHYQGTFILT